ncbi:anaerobic ribonucleoside-triphosphate reductase activating protein [Parcubacteria bacterium DG_74_2]|nr:MAG: anaerobic ribonucleoside-triphosphate reductase activating protein [Parcubacteria bacterium DG_74_2]
MNIGGLQKTTLIDYPGKPACTVFLMGCNFRCPFCYSTELVLPEQIKKQPRIAEKEFFDFLKQRKGLLDGVVLCGGEPTIHKDLSQFCKKIKNLGYLIKLDTNGSNSEMLEELINKKLIDYVAMDIKAPLKNKYEKMAGVKVNLKALKKSIKILQQGKIDFEFRTTVAPGLKEQDILEMADYIKGKNTKYFFQEFSAQKQVLNPEILKLPILKKQEIEKITAQIKPKFKTCELR